MTTETRRTALRRTMLRLDDRRLPTPHGEFRLHAFRDLADERSAFALSLGPVDGAGPLLARVHSSCVTSECLGGRDCDCAEQLDGALATIARVGRGIVFYLMQEGRGAGLTAKARDRMIVQASGHRLTTFEAYASMGLPPDLRRYDDVARMAALLGLRGPIQLMTNNPEKAEAVARALAEEKLELCGLESIQGPASAFNADYLSAKRASGHALDGVPPGAGSALPEGVRVFDPIVLGGERPRVLTASYRLPVDPERLVASLGAARGGGTDVLWLRLSVVFEASSARESVVLSLPEAVSESLPVGAEDASIGPAPGARAIAAVGRVGTRLSMSVFDRLPTPWARGRAALGRALRRLAVGEEAAIAVDFEPGSDARATLALVDPGSEVRSALEVDPGSEVRSTLEVDPGSEVRSALEVDPGSEVRSTLEVDRDGSPRTTPSAAED
ncbi:MAG TPA: GTP cyclohydrolase II [Myxococcota bacterium]|nr:GTP cyclohydrolase II [Myxococcales bacterium]HPG24264.1 GTP cyclohydrolase II [Myxococcota bacterium]